MRNFVKGLVTNRFGIVLAALNVCYFAANGFTKIHRTASSFDEIMFALQIPAAIFTAVSLKITEFLFSLSHIFFYHRFLSIVFLFFVTLQWLFIAWAAKKIAQKFVK